MKIPYHTIGTKLLLAFGCCSLLITIISVVAWSTWSHLDDQFNTILDSSIPKLNTSYQLESQSAKVQVLLNNLQKAENSAEQNQTKIQLDHELKQIKNAIYELKTNTDTTTLNSSSNQLISDIQQFHQQLQQRLQVQRKIKQTEERIRWLHQDIGDELLPLRQEVQWQLTRLLPNNTQHQAEILAEEFVLIQTIMDKEAELFSFIEQLSRQRYQSQISNAFQIIGYKIQEIEKLSQGLFYHSAAIAYKQLLTELITLIAPNQALHTLLEQDIQLTNTVADTKATISLHLMEQHEQIRLMVEHADNALNLVQEKTRQSISYGNQTLLVCFSLSILISIFITSYFVQKKIVKRLNSLSISLDAIAKGQLNFPISVTGRDEIGRLGTCLHHFCQQMQEMERTNALNLINNTQASIITCHLSGAIESVNSSAQDLFDQHITPSANMVWDFFTGADKRQLQDLFEMHSELHQSGICSLTLLDHHQHDPSYLRLDLRQFVQGHSKKVIITITDITEHVQTNRLLEIRVAEKTHSLTLANKELTAEIEERKRAEAHLKTTQSDLIQAAKMAVVGQTLTSMAHELNQPLSAISTYLYSSQLALQTKQYDTLPQSLDKIENLSQRMGKIINSLRHFAKKNPSDCPVSYVDIHQTAQHALEIVNTKAKRQHTRLVNHLPTSLSTLADSIQLEQVFVNLLVNGCDAVATHERKEIHIAHLYSTHTHHTVCVLDSGSGFSPDIIDGLFTPFTTTKDVGLGLGLNICLSLIDRFHGQITLASDTNGGAMVVLELPNYDAN